MTRETAFDPDSLALGPLRVTREAAAPDIIFVRDLVLPCRIGIHTDEQDGEQRVRFGVEIAVAPGATRDRRRPVVCYDAIIAAIRGVVEAGHINLMETLAERVATACLALEGAARVHVRVEKLDRVPGASLGVEITRGPAGPADDKVVPLNPAAPD
ncbi:MAG: dihydroneopterin aldolase [Dichotomicrobium sp.]